MPYLSPDQIEGPGGELERLVAQYPRICQRSFFQDVAARRPTASGRSISYLKIADGDDPSRPAALIVAGIHGCEWAPVDSLLGFIKRILQAYAANNAAPLEYRQIQAMVDVNGVRQRKPFERFTLDLPTVKDIIRKVNLYVVPCANPDGRLHSSSNAAFVKWRKNRSPRDPAHCNPAPRGPFQDPACPYFVPGAVCAKIASGECKGVDINKNFDIAWEIDKHYSVQGAGKILRKAVRFGFSDTYKGPSAASEAETKNIEWLMINMKVQLYIDLHAFGRKIMYPWSIDRNGSDPDQSFRMPTWDRGHPGHERDVEENGYKEYFPPDLLEKHDCLGTAVQKKIRDSAGSDDEAEKASEYDVMQGFKLYNFMGNPDDNTPSQGTSRDHAFSLQFRMGTAPVHAFTIEAGHQTENGFQPSQADHFPKIEREVHTALFTLLSYAAKNPAFVCGRGFFSGCSG